MLQCHFQAPWVSTFNSCIENELSSSKNNAPFVTFQLATIDDLTGFPHNRTLVYRGWLFDNKSSNVITFTTDKRMSKYQELLTNDKFEAVFYLSSVRKQFRFRGRARIINDEIQPEIDLTGVKSGINNILHDTDSILTTNTNASIFDGKITHDDTTNTTSTTTPTSPISNAMAVDIQKQPINSTLLSPSIGDKIFDDISQVIYIAPTQDEWQQEIKRQWKNLSKPLKKSFRKPSPKQPITDESAKIISSIQRGVDGKKDDEGLKNFSVVGLFIDYVDFYELDKDRRYIYETDEYQNWTEQEVCP
ncbi:Uncharacterized protein JA1_005055 [Spathaspora sp. JA1]|nr:Uncharacterized protein JA1_005055 [Spathaspora sp. JA1]